MAKIKKEKNPINIRGVIGAASAAMIIGALTGITLVFPQTYFGYQRTVQNNVNGVMSYILEDVDAIDDTVRIDELEDVGYLNSGISFEKATTATSGYEETYNIMFESEEKKLDATKDFVESPSMTWAAINKTKIAEVSSVVTKPTEEGKEDTINWEISKNENGYIGIEGLIDTFFTKPIYKDENGDVITRTEEHDEYYQTLLSPSMTKHIEVVEGGAEITTYPYICDEAGDVFLYKESSSVVEGINLAGETNTTTNKSLMMFMTNPTIADDLNGTFSYKYFPWGKETFMEPLFKSDDLDLMMGIAFLTFMGVLAGAVSMTVKFSKDERPSKIGMGILATALIVATSLSASLVSVITGGIASVLMIGLMIETLVKNKDEYKQDKIKKITKTIENLTDQLEFADSIESKEFYKDKLSKNKEKLISVKGK